MRNAVQTTSFLTTNLCNMTTLAAAAAATAARTAAAAAASVAATSAATASSSRPAHKSHKDVQAGGEHTLCWQAATAVAAGEDLRSAAGGHLYSAGRCGLGWHRGADDDPDDGQGRRTPSGFQPVPIPEPISHYHAGYYHNLAVGARTGTVYSWGCGTFPEGGMDGAIPALGLGPDAEDRGGNPKAVALPGRGGDKNEVVDVAGGAYHSAVLLSSGEILTFGAGQLGQLARKPRYTDRSNLPVDPYPAPVQGLPQSSSSEDKVVNLGGGFYNTFAICQSGELYCAGENQNKQCGDGPANLTQMTRVDLRLDDDQGGEGTATEDPVVEVAGGYCHTLARTLAGRVLTLGCGDDGQRGDGRLEVDDGDIDDDEEEGDNRNRPPVPPRPVVSKLDLPGQRRAIGVAAGANHSIVLGEDGIAYAFGANDLGQCGISSHVAPGINANSNSGDDDDGNDDEEEEESTAIASPEPVKLPEGTGRVVQVSAGYAHTTLRTEEGRIFVFGQNSNGQLGIGEGGEEDDNEEGRSDGKDLEEPVVEPMEIRVNLD